jgi:hypothetical protein
MDQAEGLVPERRVRRWRSVAEKRRIVELTLVPGASVALVARAHGVNASIRLSNAPVVWLRLVLNLSDERTGISTEAAESGRSGEAGCGV